ncbi:DNA adenine methylase [Lacrimispora sphenoides]|uniref:Site-specific DNA-adenine methylase n=1 Tax=Lacrimispora sphenoides JCM 1415 TaxID=1297793 RepID=A0ABY1CHU7_9FIRM|nr:DNA adenine methylase [Lacrimispora sphenoides]SEU04205.1 Site-specific DNA-adenine methylase [[Clostridium] sphenoides JCM 1415]SUY48854.1 D12 class N6 adenine-specific DNA methyltransferase [Lacrimispora sphenoides]
MNEKYNVARAWGYYGGKAKVVDRILSCLPLEYTSWHELFIGGGSITFSKEKPACCHKEVINDYDRTISNFYRVLSDKQMGKRLMDELLHQGMNKVTFMKAREYVLYNNNRMYDFELAVSTYIEISQSFSALRNNYAVGRKESTYENAIKHHLPRVRERLLSGIDIKSEDAIMLLDGIREDYGAMVYLDPPYRSELRNGRGYRCELNTLQQIRLLRVLQKCKCRVMLSGYRDEIGPDLYDSYLLPYGFKLYKLSEVVKSCQTKKKKDKAVEYIWCNYELPSGALVEGEITPRYKYVQYDEYLDDKIIKKVS